MADRKTTERNKKSNKRTGASRAKTTAGGRQGKNVISLNDVRNIRDGASSGRTSSRTSPYTSRLNRQSSFADTASRQSRSQSALYGSKGRSSASLGGEGSSRRREASSPVVHKKVSGVGYEGAARVFLVAFLLLAVLYIGGNILRYALKSAVSYDTVQIGSIDTPKSADGVIIRTETAYRSDIEGELTFLVPDGEKVMTGETIATVKVKDVVDEARQSLNDMNEDIIEAEKVKEEIDKTNEDARRLNLEIKALADDAAMDFVSLDALSLRDFTNNAEVKQEMRNQAILSGSRSAETASAREKAENLIAENSKAYTALEGGIVCLETDGLEEKLNTGSMNSLTESDIKKSGEASHVAGSEVSAGENIFKIINSNEWYIAAYIDSDYVLDWAQGDRHTIYLTDPMGEELEMDVVVETFIPDDKKTYMVLRANKYMLDFMSVRNISFEIDRVQTGYKIANSSIVESTLIKIPAEYVTDSTVTKSNGTVVSVGAVKGDYAYFPVGYDTLVIGDSIISPDGSDVYVLADVETLQGVYIMNTGIAQFYTIDTEGSTSNSTHTILDPARNANLSIYDRVVVDPKNIEEDQMLYK